MSKRKEDLSNEMLKFTVVQHKQLLDSLRESVRKNLNGSEPKDGRFSLPYGTTAEILIDPNERYHTRQLKGNDAEVYICFSERIHQLLEDFRQEVAARLDFIINLQSNNDLLSLDRIKNIITDIYDRFRKRWLIYSDAGQLKWFKFKQLTTKRSQRGYLNKLMKSASRELIERYRTNAYPDALEQFSKLYSSSMFKSTNLNAVFADCVPRDTLFPLSELTNAYNAYFNKRVSSRSFAVSRGVKGRFKKCTRRINKKTIRFYFIPIE